MSRIQNIIKRNKAGQRAGVFSCCSSHPDVIRAVLLRCKKAGCFALVESTSNQVNQNGGYSGMNPQQFSDYVYGLADEIGFPKEEVVIGGDHLGPLPWVDLEEEEALANAERLVSDCVLAGYRKIHLDTSMRVASDDPEKPFYTSTCAERGARLCAACESAFAEYKASHPDAEAPVYVIGSEVPVPGGDYNAGVMDVSLAEDALATIDIYRDAFTKRGLAEAFSRVVAIVVEMGIEFHEFNLDEYDRRRAAGLTAALKNTDLCIEGHSSDYQTTENLSRLCEDGVAILKVGPAFTFSMREAYFDLEKIEREVYAESPEKWSNYRDTLDMVMMRDDSRWKSYYQGTPNEQRIARAFSFYDRCRYYMNQPEVLEARQTLLDNLSGNVISLCVLSQYLPNQYYRVRNGKIRNEPLDIVLDRIGDRVDAYMVATDNNGVSHF